MKSIVHLVSRRAALTALATVACSLLCLLIVACSNSPSTTPVERPAEQQAASNEQSPPAHHFGTPVAPRDLAPLGNEKAFALRKDATNFVGSIKLDDPASMGETGNMYMLFKEGLSTAAPSSTPLSPSAEPAGGGSGGGPALRPAVPAAVTNAPATKRGEPDLSRSRRAAGERRALADADAAGAAAPAPSPDGARRVFVRHPEIAGALPSQHEELWVIAKACPPDAIRDADGRVVRAVRDDDELPGSGSLVTTMPGEARPVPVPLKHTAVKAAVAGNIASVNVTQQYVNPFTSKIEAVYVFPLPENAAVSDFLMKVGDRTIRGVIRDRAEAEQIYAQARAQGHVASIMTQERPNIFTQKVANIEPGKQIDIEITYFNTLAYVDGAFEMVFPMVVAPRFNPPASYTGIGPIARGSAPGSSGQQTEVAYLRPRERSGHDIGITVEIDAGVALEGVNCASHVVETRRDPANPARATVTLSSRDTLPNKDFVLRYAVAGGALKTGIVTARDKDGHGYFSMLIVPPASTDACRRAPVEMIFVLDCSGSMKGRPIEQAVAAAERALRRLEPDDTFQIINFSQTASQLGAAPLPATDANVERGITHVRSLFAEGGTYMINGLRASLAFPHDPRRLRYVCFLTDGLIGNEQEVLSEVSGRLGASRIFSFGVGTSPNRDLLDAMAKVGRGCVAHLNAGDDSVAIIDRFFDRISRPALTDVRLEARLGAPETVEFFPRVVPDVYVGRPVVINGRFTDGADAGWKGIVVRGRQGDNTHEFTIALDATRTHAALPAIWARAKIADLADYATDRDVHLVPERVRETALRHGLLSSFTAFVAVDSMSQTSGTFGTTVAVPVPMPEGVRYETTVPER
ncbi:MAG: VIT domain-containing protein [Phycisphaerales bacterium]